MPPQNESERLARLEAVVAKLAISLDPIGILEPSEHDERIRPVDIERILTLVNDVPRLPSWASPSGLLFARFRGRIPEEPYLYFGDLVSRHETLKQETHSYFAMQSLGLDLSAVPLHRFIPCRVYLSKGNPETVQAVSSALKTTLEALAFEISDEFPAQRGSFFQKWFGKTKEAVMLPEVQKRLEKLEKAAELKIIAQPQADVDKTLAESVKVLFDACPKGEEVAMQVGSVLLIRYLKDGKMRNEVKTLSASEMIYLEKHQDILSTPSETLRKLANLSGSGGSGEGPVDPTRRPRRRITLPGPDEE
jgi:hypothetical protein